MAHRIDDRWLWLGLGVALVIAVTGFRASIQDVIRLTKTREGDMDNESAEDDEVSNKLLPLGSLKTLATSPNYNLREAAIELIVARYLQSDHKKEIHKQMEVDAKSSDDALHRRATAALELLRQPTTSYYELPNASSDTLPFLPTLNSLEGGNEPTSAAEWAGDQEEELLVPSENRPVAGWTAVPRERRRFSDSEVRRRRREAVVLHEGTGRIQESDIIRPQDLSR